MNPYYSPSAGIQNPMADRRRRMTDSSLPGIGSYRTSNPYLQSGAVGSQGWMDHNQDRRYSLSMGYPSESAVVDEVYGPYDHTSMPAPNDQMAGYPPYTTQDQYATTTHGYTYPPQADQPSGSPHSPPNRTVQRMNSAPTLPPLAPANGLPINRLPSENGMMLNSLDYRSTSSGAPGPTTAGDSPSAGSEYDEPRSSYQLQSTSGGYGASTLR